MHLSVRRKFYLRSGPGADQETAGPGANESAKGYHIFSAQNLVKSKKSHHVRRCPIFPTKSSVEQKKRSTPPQAVVSAKTSQNFRVSII